MTDAISPLRRSVTLRSASGRPVITLDALPAAAVAVAALTLAPRLTAAAALVALAKRMSLAIDAAPGAAQ